MKALSYAMSVMIVVTAISVYAELVSDSWSFICPFSQVDAVARVVSDPYFIRCVCLRDLNTALIMLKAASPEVSGVCVNDMCVGSFGSVVAVLYVPVCNATVTVYVG